MSHLVISILRQWNRDTKCFSRLPKIPQLLNGRVRIWTVKLCGGLNRYKFRDNARECREGLADTQTIQGLCSWWLFTLLLTQLVSCAAAPHNLFLHWSGRNTDHVGAQNKESRGALLPCEISVYTSRGPSVAWERGAGGGEMQGRQVPSPPPPSSQTRLTARPQLRNHITVAAVQSRRGPHLFAM